MTVGVGRCSTRAGTGALITLQAAPRRWKGTRHKGAKDVQT